MRASVDHTVHTSDGLDLAVYADGDPAKPTILLVHGFPDNASVWDRVVAELSADFHVVRYDVRGAGASDAPQGRAGYRLDQLADDLARVAREHGNGPVHLLAHDWGSIQAWHAVTEPDSETLFASFTSVSGPCLDHVASWLRRNARRGRFAALLGQAAHSWYIGAFHLPGAKQAWRLAPLRAKFGAETRDAVNGVELYRANMLARATQAQSRRTSVPVQQLVLTDDPFVRPAIAESATPWCTRLWRRELRAGHWAPRSHPRELAELTTELVRHVDDGADPRGLRRARVRPATARRGRFDGHLVLVTGAGSGIGKASALAFARGGADVLAADIDGASAEATAAELRELGVLADAYPVDVADADAVQAMADQVQARHGTPDIVLANAGIGLAGGMLRTSTEQWRRVIEVNLLGAVHTLRCFGEQLVQRGQGGHLVATASMAAYAPWPVLSAYATSKAGLLSAAQSLRTELAPHGIGVSAICPGLVDTNIAATTRFAGVDAETERAMQQAAARGYRLRGFTPNRVADAVLTAVVHNRAVMPVTPEAKLFAVLSRISPGLVRGVGRLLKG